MKANGIDTRSIWLEPDGWSVGVIDQIALPLEVRTATLRTLDDTVQAIAEMKIRGAPLIGATAAYGMALAARADDTDDMLDEAAARLIAARAHCNQFAMGGRAHAPRPSPRCARVSAPWRLIALRTRSAMKTWRSIGALANTAASCCTTLRAATRNVPCRY